MRGAVREAGREARHSRGEAYGAVRESRETRHAAVREARHTAESDSRSGPLTIDPSAGVWCAVRGGPCDENKVFILADPGRNIETM